MTSAQTDPYQILYLNSYHPGYTWSDEIHHSMMEELNQNLGENFELYTEYLDGKRYGSALTESLGNKLTEVYQLKYRDKEFDVILVSDQIAFDFAEKYRNLLFPDVPVLFSGVENYQHRSLKTSGIISSTDVKKNIDLILETFPSTKTIWVLTDQSSTGLHNRTITENLVKAYSGTVDIKFLNDANGINLEDLLQKLTIIPKNEPVLFLDYYLDDNKNFLDVSHTIPSIVKVLKPPLFSHVDKYFDYGVFGGCVSSSSLIGVQLADLATQILEGVPVESLPLQQQTTIPSFNYSLLERFQLSVENLPPTSILLKTSNFGWHKSVIVVGDDINYPPYSFLDEDGNPAGFNIDLIKAVARTMGYDVEIRLDEWYRIKKSLENNEIDVIPGLVYSDDRSLSYAFSAHHNINIGDLFTRTDTHIHSLSELSGKTVVTVKGDIVSEFLQKSYRDIEQIEVPTYGIALSLVENGTYDYAGLTKFPSLYIINELDYANLKANDLNFLVSELCMVVKKGNEHLLSILNNGVRILKITGELDEIYDKWLGAYEDNNINQFLIKYRPFLIGAAGLIVLLIGLNFLLNIMVNKKTEMLRKSEENLLVTLNSIGDAVISTDIKGRVKGMNPVGEELTGWSISEAMGQPLHLLFNLVSEHTREPVENPVDHVLKKGDLNSLPKNIILINKNGKEFRISNSGSPIRSKNGNIVGAVLVFRDITEEYLLQEQLHQSHKMDAVGQLASGLAHDFNNVLGGIMGGAELLLPYLKDDKDSLKYHTMIIESVNRASDLTHKLLTFSRQQFIGSKPIDIHKAIEDTVSILYNTIDKRIRIKTDLAAKHSVIVGDSAQIENIFLNMGINSSHAMPDGGVLTFESRIQELSSVYCESSPFDLKPGKYIAIKVNDSGKGIPPDTLPRIFEPFFTTKKQGKGTGLGLASVYGTIQQHKGSINVYSEIGIGTSFQILLPLANVQTSLDKEKQAVVMGQGTILLVDDEKLMRLTGKALLESFGYKVLLANDGKDGLKIYKQHRDKIDLVVLDMIMPEMNGKDCFIELKNLSPDLKIILASGFYNTEDLGEISSMGLNGFIQKPYQGVEISRIIAKVLKGEKVLSV